MNFSGNPQNYNIIDNVLLLQFVSYFLNEIWQIPLPKLPKSKIIPKTIILCQNYAHS